MIDKDAPSTRRALEEVSKPGVRNKLITFAMWRLESEPDAEDLVQEALAKVCDPQDSPWDEGKGKSFVRHVGSIINGLASNERRSARARREMGEATLGHDIHAVDGSPLPDEALGMHRESARLLRLGTLLRSRIEEKGDQVALDMLDCARRGKVEIEEVEQETGHSPDEIRDAHRRLKYHARQILAEEDEAERKRMNEARENAKIGEVTP
jgi:hypothetical protein